MFGIREASNDQFFSASEAHWKLFSSQKMASFGLNSVSFEEVGSVLQFLLEVRL